MSILETPKASDSEDTSNTLKLELKQWEKAFAAANGGRKAGREDIKQHPHIANKYKKYNKLRCAPENPTAISKYNKRPSPIAQNTTLEHKTPKRQKLSQPPHPATLDPYDSPRSVQRTPTLHRTCIGPTPQKDGKVLGLFDLLSPVQKGQTTPSKTVSSAALPRDASAKPLQPLSSVDLNSTLQPSSDARPSKSPVTSTPKRTGRAEFLTPSIRRTAEQKTPGSRGAVSKLRFDVTPAFLRRDSQHARGTTQSHGLGEVDENEELSWSPVAVRRRPKPAGQGLSALVKGLRALEDEKLDEEMELMREMEQEDAGLNQGLQSHVRKPVVAVEDSQVADMPLGPDGLGSSDDDIEEIQNERKGRDGRPLKVWKKKGQKRTTRKSNMRPNTAKWKPETEWKGPADQAELTEVKETQIVERGSLSGPTMGDDHGGDDMEYISEEEGDRTRDKSIVQANAKDSNNSKAKGDSKPANEDAQAAPKKTKKINATAHANFRALKIKNKQSKAKGGGRYGRGRR